MDDEQFLDSYHNESTPPGPDVPAELAGFMLAADPVLGQAAELARVCSPGGRGTGDRRRLGTRPEVLSLSEKCARWVDYRTPARGFGIHAYAHRVHQPIRLTDQQMRAHPEWRNFGLEQGRHPPMRGWLGVPLIGSDGVNDGFISRHPLDAVAQLQLPEYRAKVADPPA
jgi:hypothetical protein